MESRKCGERNKTKEKSRKKKKDNGVNFKRFRKNSIAAPCTSPVAFSLPIVPNETQEERERRRLFEDDLMNEKKADVIWDLEEYQEKEAQNVDNFFCYPYFAVLLSIIKFCHPTKFIAFC